MISSSNTDVTQRLLYCTVYCCSPSLHSLIESLKFVDDAFRMMKFNVCMLAAAYIICMFLNIQFNDQEN